MGQHSSPNTSLPTQAPRVRRFATVGAVFLMATSAIGPAFITHTSTFTVQLGAAFAFAILVSTLIDIAIQMNTWRIIGVTGTYAQDLANRALPGAGYVLAGLVVFGGFVFNVGNTAGAGLGLNTLLGLDPRLGAGLSAIIAIGIFLSHRAGAAIDRIVVLLGVLFFVLTLYVAVSSAPPVGDALRQSVLPERVDFLVITTLVGATVGGYVTYAGAHRLIASGVSGPQHIRRITRSSVAAVLVTSVVRAVFFLAILGVVAAGATLSTDNPAASAFSFAAGEVGLRVFGLALWAAGLSSMIGASYTCVSFLKTLSPLVARREPYVVCGFLLLTVAFFVVADQPPVPLLVFAGALNGMILPLGLGLMLWIAARSLRHMNGYAYPRWLLTIGVGSWLLTIFIAYSSLDAFLDLTRQILPF